jgi:hypothetical protein
MATTLLTNQNKKTISLESKNHHGMFANIFLNINGGKKSTSVGFCFHEFAVLISENKSLIK